MWLICRQLQLQDCSHCILTGINQCALLYGDLDQNDEGLVLMLELFLVC